MIALRPFQTKIGGAILKVKKGFDIDKLPDNMKEKVKLKALSEAGLIGEEGKPDTAEKKAPRKDD